MAQDSSARFAEHRKNLAELKESLRAQLKELSDAPQNLQSEVMELRGEVSLLGFWQQEHVKEIGELRELPQATHGQLAELREELAQLRTRLEAQGSQLAELPGSIRAEVLELGEETSRLRVRQQAQAAQLKEVQTVQETEGKELRNLVAHLSESTAEAARLAGEQEHQGLRMQELELLEAEERSKLRVEICEVLAQELSTLRKEVAACCSSDSFQRLEADVGDMRQRLSDHGELLGGFKGLEEDVKRLDCSCCELARDFSEYQDDMLLRDRTLSAACRSGISPTATLSPLGGAGAAARPGGLLTLPGRTEQLAQALETEVATRNRLVAELHKHVRQEIMEVRAQFLQQCEELASSAGELGQGSVEHGAVRGEVAEHIGNTATRRLRSASALRAKPMRQEAGSEVAVAAVAAGAAERPRDHLAALRSLFPEAQQR